MPNKWIDIRSPEVSAVEVAEDVLHGRMQYVQQMLPLAAHQYLCDVEHVHRLRVGCRRAGAALQAFRPLIRGRRSKSLRKWLRRIRRAAGPARDLDVLLERMRKNNVADPNHDALLARLERQRTESQHALIEAEALARQGELSHSIDRCLESLRKSKGAARSVSIGEFAKIALRKASQPIHQQVELEHFSLEDLHELRIAGKRLRYSIELFHGAFPSELRSEVYPLVEKLQSRLGRLNDHATAQLFFQRLLATMPADDQAAYLAQCIVAEHKAAVQSRAEFLRWWNADRATQLEFQLDRFTI